MVFLGWCVLWNDGVRVALRVALLCRYDSCLLVLELSYGTKKRLILVISRPAY
jgi:hypothetical protein